MKKRLFLYFSMRLSKGSLIPNSSGIIMCTEKTNAYRMHAVLTDYKEYGPETDEKQKLRQ